MSAANPCPVTEDVGGYRLVCILHAGHAGTHWADVLEPLEPNRQARLEAAEDRAEQAAFDAARERS